MLPPTTDTWDEEVEEFEVRQQRWKILLKGWAGVESAGGTGVGGASITACSFWEHDAEASEAVMIYTRT